MCMSASLFQMCESVSIPSCVNTYCCLLLVCFCSVLNVRAPNGTHPHEGSFLHGVQQADPQVIALVVHGDHVECHGLRHGQDDGQEPDQDDLNGHPLRNADPFDPAPRGHGAVPARSHMWRVNGGSGGSKHFCFLLANCCSLLLLT